MQKEFKNLICRLIIMGLVLICASCCKKVYVNNVKDIDGNIYKTVAIGNYRWMAENLKTTIYNNGIEIPKVTGNSAWSGLSSGAYCWYNDNGSNAGHYGALYNWYAVNTGNLCPNGWRVPSDEEWKYLEGYADSMYRVGDPVWDTSGLRGYDAGKRLKAASGWRSDGNGTDIFGFRALPGGEHLNSFNNTLGSSGFWWSSTEAGASSAWYRSMIYAFDYVSRDSHPKKMGFSVRCLRDN
jgi:uncharacterized protein (TIGR02145 family)